MWIHCGLTPATCACCRLESDGTVSARTVVFDPSAPLDSAANPALHNGDVVVVPRNGWSRTNDFLAQAVAPLGPLLNAASLFRHPLRQLRPLPPRRSHPAQIPNRSQITPRLA